MALLQFLLYCSITLLIVTALEMTPQLSEANNEPANSKSKAHYLPFSLVDDDVDVTPVELPLDVELEESVESTRSHSLPPAWLQFAEEPIQKSRAGNKASYIKVPSPGQQFKHLHALHSHPHEHGACTIEITSKVPGICQPMTMGSACISGEFMEFYSASHCSNL